jgi:hypothetical protein
MVGRFGMSAFQFGAYMLCPAYGRIDQQDGRYGSREVNRAVNCLPDVESKERREVKD